MEKYVVSNKILADSVASGIKFLEQGDYRMAEKYLEYGYDNSELYRGDQFILYALAITYYNLAEYDKSNDVIVRLKDLDNLNEQILDTVNQMLIDLQNISKKESRVTEDEDYLLAYNRLFDALDLTEKQLKTMVKKTNDGFYEFFLTQNQSGEEYQKFKRNLPYALKSLEAVEKALEIYYGSEVIDYQKLYHEYSVSINSSHSVFLIIANKTNLLNDMLLDPLVPKSFKNEILFDFHYYTELGYINKRVVKVEMDGQEEKVVIADLPDIQKYAEEVEGILNETPLVHDRILHKYIYKIIFKYLLMHYSELESVDIRDIVNRTFNFIYQTHINLNEEIERYFNENLRFIKTDEKDVEIYKIVVALEKFML